MIRIQLVHEGRVVKTISSRVHESVVLEQVKRYDQPVDEIRIVEGELSEAGKGFLHHVAKKIVPAAMAAGIALAGASGAYAQNVGVPGQNRDFPGLDMSIGQHLGAIFSPNYQEIMRQRNYQRQTQQQVWNAEQNEIRQAQIQQARERGRAEMGLPPAGSQNVRVYDQARTSNDGKYFIIYGMDNSITRIPTQGTEFMPGDSQRLPHYIAPSGQVFYVRHPAGTMTEGFAPIGTIPASGTGNNKPTGTGTPIEHDDEELNGNTPNLGNTTSTQQPTGKTTNLNINANGQISLGDEEEPAGIQEASGKELVDIIMAHQADVKRYTANQKADPAPELAQALSTHYGTEDFKQLFDKDLAAIFYQADQATRPQQESITEGTESGLQAILDQFPDAFKAFKEGGEIDDNQEFFDALYNYYADSGEMPYGVQKARDGDPYQWISDRLDMESGIDPVAEGAEFGAYYSEQLAQKVFDQNPNLDTSGRADAYFDAAWPIMVADLGKKRAQYEISYNEDFPMDTVSAYTHLQKQQQGVAEGIVDKIRAANYDRLSKRSYNQADKTKPGQVSVYDVNKMKKGDERYTKANKLKGIDEASSAATKEVTPNWAKYVLDQLYNSNGAVTMTDLWDEHIPGLRDMFYATAQEKGLDPEEDFQDVEHYVMLKLEEIIRLGRGTMTGEIEESDFEATAADQGAADLNIIIQLKKASDNEIPQPLRLADGTIKVTRETAQKILDKFNQLRPASKEMMQNTLNYTEGFRELLNYFGEREVDESVDQLSNAMQPVREAEMRARRLIKSVFGK